MNVDTRDGMYDGMTARAVPSKTLATWLAVFGGALGLHHFYLGGRWRWLGAR